MDLRRAGAVEGPHITGFRGTALIVDGIARAGGVILTPEGAMDWDGADFIAATAIDPVPEFVLLGTGAAL